jgi:hypothetical protein
MVDPRYNRIGRCMAQGWLGFLEAMKPVLIPVYGSAEGVDNIIAQVRHDYSRIDYHGYNLMYGTCDGDKLTSSYSVVGRKPSNM